MQESCTLFHAIALLAYRDDAVAQRYSAKPGVRASGQRKRQEDVCYPKGTGLPGTEVFAGITDDQRLQPLVRRWKEADKARWSAAKAKLWNATQSDDAPAFGTDGKIAREFWLTHDLDSPEVAYLRFRRSDLMRLMAETPERILNPPIVVDSGESRDTVSTSMKFDSGYISRRFITNDDEKIAELEEPYILICEEKLSALMPILPLLEAVAQSRKPLLVIAEDVERELLATLVLNKLRGGMKIAAVKAPGVGDQREALLDDIATLTGGLVVNDSLGIRLGSVTLDMLGTAKKVVIEKDKTTIIGGSGKKTKPADAAPIEMSTSPAVHRTVAQETELKRWLMSQIAAAPRTPRPKAAMKQAATDVGIKFSARAFERCWHAAILETQASNWSAPGRKPARRIDTRI